jgi:hypothetical protein
MDKQKNENSATQEPQNHEKESNKPDPSIKAAVIGGVCVIIAAIISILPIFPNDTSNGEVKSINFWCAVLNPTLTAPVLNCGNQATQNVVVVTSTASIISPIYIIPTPVSTTPVFTQSPSPTFTFTIVPSFTATMFSTFTNTFTVMPIQPPIIITATPNYEFITFTPSPGMFITVSVPTITTTNLGNEYCAEGYDPDNWSLDEANKIIIWQGRRDGCVDVEQRSEFLDYARKGYTIRFGPMDVPGEINACHFQYVAGETLVNGCNSPSIFVSSGEVFEVISSGPNGGFRWCPRENYGYRTSGQACE